REAERYKWRVFSGGRSYRYHYARPACTVLKASENRAVPQTGRFQFFESFDPSNGERALLRDFDSFRAAHPQASRSHPASGMRERLVEG
ncbi:MAG TPA: hypothetical protein P5307_26670, partial [Pirellulaceae bacterium]|nr:hypothetical protein [Pirellulaceae bacterium]